MGAGDSVLLELETGEPAYSSNAASASGQGQAPNGAGATQSETSGSGIKTGSQSSQKKIKSRLDKLRNSGHGTMQNSKSCDNVQKSPSTPPLSLGRKLTKSLTKGRKGTGSLAGTPSGSHQSINEIGMESSSRMFNLEGTAGRKNKVLVSPCRSKAESNFVFFPGDVQDFTDNMAKDPRCRHWSAYSYENIMERLESRFPNSNIILVIPSRKHMDVYSCYDNFVDTDTIGTPADEQASDFKASRHLVALLDSLQTKSGKPGTQSRKNGSVSSTDREAKSEPSSLLRQNTAPGISQQAIEEAAAAVEKTAAMPGESPVETSSSLQPSPTSPSPLVDEPRSGSFNKHGPLHRFRLFSRSSTQPTLDVSAAAATSRGGSSSSASSSQSSAQSPTEQFQMDVPLSTPVDTSLPILVCGFSKGCVVLNQLVAELNRDTVKAKLQAKKRASVPQVPVSAQSVLDVKSEPKSEGGHSTEVSTSSSQASCISGTSDDGGGGMALGARSQGMTSLFKSDKPADEEEESPEEEEIWPKSKWEQFHRMIWLDGGHSGTKGAWITESELVKTLASSIKAIDVHSSPYQANNDDFLWKRKEYLMFRHLLHSSHRLPSRISIFEHSVQEQPTIKAHFRVLDVF